MTDFVDTDYLIVVSAGRNTSLHRIIPVERWQPTLIDIADRDLVGFPDELIGTIVAIDVMSIDGRTVGYLVPTSDRCALCHNPRHITVHFWSEEDVANDADTLTLYEPDRHAYSVMRRKPCPACRYVDYELSYNDDRAAGGSR